MGADITLTASDGHEFMAYLCEPEGNERGAIVVIQEIFGVNKHIRDVTERLALLGYRTIAPALYDRYERGFDAGYEAEDMERGRNYKTAANDNLDGVMADLIATKEAVDSAGSVGITGFCWGGFATWLAACRLDFQAAACYYGGGILDFNDEKPKCPTILHFGRQDQSIPMADVEVITSSHPEVDVYVYEADHGFHCDMRGQFNARAANIAGMRTIRLFDQHIGG